MIRFRRDRPLPRVEVDTGPSVPGWVLRLGAVLVTGATPVLAAVQVPAQHALSASADAGAADGPFAPMGVVLAILVAGATAWRPGHRPGLAAIGAVVLITVLMPREGGLAHAVWLAPLGYLGLRLNLWAATTGATARVELAALARSARLDACVVGVTMLIGVAASLAEGRSFTGIAVGAVALLLFVSLAARTRKEPS